MSLSSTVPVSGNTPSLAADATLPPHLERHIAAMWPSLTRGLKNAVEAARDPKLEETSAKVLIYVSAAESAMEIRGLLEQQVDPGALHRLEVRSLPGAPERVAEHGLLYLPGRYVVPGGRFNEMYGWDSYFMALGLLRGGQVDLARSVADQMLYQVRHYGVVLNCNRTYCLTRSQPPFLSRLVMAVFAHTKDLAWLRGALPLVQRYYAYWISPPRLLPALGLSRYHASGVGPAPEVLAAERDETGRDHYQRVCQWMRDHPAPEPWWDEVYDRATDRLTPDGYVNDRTCRESGFDLSHRFGFCGLDSRSYVPVCLNTLLWCQERDIATMHILLESPAPTVNQWEEMAETRRQQMMKHFWDEWEGLFLDWSLRANARSPYAYATAFWPLWAGWAEPEQARRLVTRLPDFLAPGGLLTSLETTGCQWDAPFTWAPLTLLAAQGLQNYEFTAEAREVADRFVTLAAAEFTRTGHLYEKYDAVARTTDVTGKLAFGYPSNETGFGWTNAALLELMALGQ